MPRRLDASPRSRAMAARSVLFVLALALSGVALWLIVTADTVKRVDLGVLTGIWGGVVAAFLFSRRFASPAGYPVAAPEHVVPREIPAPGAELQVRPPAKVERRVDAEERRAYEETLQRMIREEIRQTLTSEVSALRSEIASLRSELVEKVGGQLRLERIETTRVIGSDLEALQHEVRQLKVAQDGADEPLRLAPRAAAPPPAAVHRPPLRNAVEPAAVRPARPARDAVSEAATAPQPAVTSPPDAFAALPRLSPFTAEEMEPVESPAAVNGTSADTDGSSYRGRRRRTEQDEAAESDGDEGVDLLARILSRESAR